MKKNRILLLCLFALISIFVLASCNEDPIKDNRVIGKWTVTKGEGTFTLDVQSNQTFTRTKTISGEEPKIISGTWEASSVTEGIFKSEGKQIAHFTAYGEVLEYYDDTLGGEDFEYKRVK